MEIEIFNEGFTNEINPMSPMELECIYGGGGNLNILSQCDKWYKAGGQSVTCKCGYKVFLPTP